MTQESHTDKALKTIAKGAGLVFIAIIFGKLFSYLYVLLLSRLGPEKYGAISLGFAIMEFLLMFSTLGLREGITRYVSFNLGKKDYAKIKGAIIDPLKWVLFLSVTYALVIFIFSSQIADIFSEPLLSSILKWLAVALPFLATGSLFLSALVGFKKAHYAIMFREMINQGLKFILTAILFLVGYGFFGAIFAYVSGIIVMWIIAFYFLEKKTFSIVSTKIKAKHYFKKIFSFSWPLALANILWIILGKIDVLMLGIFKTTDIVGIYSVALTTSSLLIVVPLALSTLFFPVSTEAYAKKQNLRKIYNIVNKWVFFILFPLFLIIVIFSKQILFVIFGKNYVPGWQALSILALGYLFLGFGYNNLNVLQTIKKTKLILLITTSATILNVILNYVLIPKYGMLGGAIATTVAYLFISFVSIAYLFKYTKLNPFRKVLLKAIVASVTSATIIFLIKEFIDASKLLLFVLLFFIFLIILLLMLFLLKAYEKEDIMIMKSFAKKFKLNFLKPILNRL